VPAYAERKRLVAPRERALALAGVVLIQAALGIALLIGLRVQIETYREAAQRLIEVTLEPAPRPAPPPPAIPQRGRTAPSAPKAEVPKPNGSPGPVPAPPALSVPSVVPMPAAHVSGGGAGSGAGAGSGTGGGAGGSGTGEGAGGTDLEQIAGEITPRDYPRHLGNAGIGGRVGILFTVGVNGRVTACRVTSSSGIPELDALTCRLIQKRFRYRPSTDRYGRPVADEVEGEQIWEAR
jgi:protein TonB